MTGFPPPHWLPASSPKHLRPLLAGRRTRPVCQTPARAEKEFADKGTSFRNPPGAVDSALLPTQTQLSGKTGHSADYFVGDYYRQPSLRIAVAHCVKRRHGRHTRGRHRRAAGDDGLIRLDCAVDDAVQHLRMVSI